jgi:hypothetical protein
LVIGRYSVLPFYREVEADLAVNGCKLINSFAQHCWIANFEYYRHFKDVTPETWDDSQGKITLVCPKSGDHLRTSSRKATSRAAS